jgi:transposase
VAVQLLPDPIWEVVKSKLPVRRQRPRGGRPALSDRRVLTGIVFVLRTGIAWVDLPAELGCGCGMTCLRRLRDWQIAGVWPEVQRVLAENLRRGDQIDWSRVEVESPFLPAQFKGFTSSEPDQGMELLT